MQQFENIVITNISAPFPVFSEKGRRFRMENRPAYALSFCSSGQITYNHNGHTYIAHPGNTVLLPKGGTYSLFGDKEGLFHVVDFQCEQFDCRDFLVFPLRNPKACLHKLESLSHGFLFNDKRMTIYSLFYELLAEIQRQQAASRTPLSSAMDYLEQHIGDPALSNEVLAAKMGISEVYFRKLFKTQYGMTPKQYILDVRIQKAKQLLPDSTFSVTAIAELCGFSGVYHFCKIFKQRTGYTPTEYAETHRFRTI